MLEAEVITLLSGIAIMGNVINMGLLLNIKYRLSIFDKVVRQCPTYQDITLRCGYNGK